MASVFFFLMFFLTIYYFAVARENVQLFAGNQVASRFSRILMDNLVTANEWGIRGFRGYSREPSVLCRFSWVLVVFRG